MANIRPEDGIDAFNQDLDNEEIFNRMQNNTQQPVQQPVQPVVQPPALPIVQQPVQPVYQQPLAPRERTYETTTNRNEDISTTSTQISPQYRQATNDLYDSYQNEIDAQGILQQEAIKEGAEKFNLINEQQKIVERGQEAREQIIAQGQQELKAMDDNLVAKTEEMSNMKYEGFWEKKTTAQKIIGAISMALGAYASATGGGENTAMKIIDKAMEEDYKMYQSKVQSKIEAIKNSRLNVEQKKGMILNELQNLEAKQLSQVNVIALKMDNLANKTTSPKAKAQLQTMVARMEQKFNEKKVELAKLHNNTVGKKTSNQLKSLMLDAQGKVVQEGPDDNMEIVGFGQVRGTEKDFRDMKTAFSQNAATNALIDEILTKSKSVSKLEPGRRAEVETNLGILMGQLRLPLQGPGAMTDKDYARLRELVGDPAALFGRESTARKQLEAIRGQMNRKLDADAHFGIKDYKKGTISEGRGVKYENVKDVNNEKVKMITPSGRRITVPAPDVEAFKSKGASVIGEKVKMVIPNGRTISVTADKVAEMEAKGAKRQ